MTQYDVDRYLAELPRVVAKDIGVEDSQPPRTEEAVAKGYTAERDGFSRPDNSSTYKAELFRFVPFATASEVRGLFRQLGMPGVDQGER
jgi:hypothetical protein